MMEDRKAYIDKLAAQLKEWDAEIDKLQAKAEQAQAQAKADYSKEIQTLLNKKEETLYKLNEVRQASEEAWQDLKSGLETSWNELKSALGRAQAKFK